MKKILGLDIGTNSIGSALVSIDENSSNSKLEYSGCRIIPMPDDQIQDFNKGSVESAAAARTGFRSMRRRNERHILRRQRLHKVLNEMGFLPEHYVAKIDFSNGKSDFFKDEEPKIAWSPTADGKYRFLFMDSYAEMVALIRGEHPEFGKIPLDWTVYYLRKKALTKKISKEELAWILLHFNTKRGYYQRGADEEDDNKTYECLTVKDVVPADIDHRGDQWYNVTFENSDLTYPTKTAEIRNLIGKEIELIVTRKIQKDGTIKPSFSKPSEDDWTLKKKRTESLIENGRMTVGEFILNALITNPHTKIRGKLIATIERKYYRSELEKILQCQKDFHPEFADRDLYERCVKLLYAKNESHRRNIISRDFTYLFVNDIIFYHRPLKSKKSLIDNCPFEENHVGEKSFPVKCVAKSNPFYQEFRLWQFISNLKIYRRIDDQDVTAEYLSSPADYAELFDFLNGKKEISQKQIFSCGVFGRGVSSKNFYWNYADDDKKQFPCNETRALIVNALNKACISDIKKLDSPIAGEGTPTWLYRLWHLIYSVTDKEQYEKGLASFADKFLSDNDKKDAFVESFAKIEPFKNDYGAYSEKAIKRLLPLMRCGKYWDFDKIDSATKSRIANIINGVSDESISKKVRDECEAKGLSEEANFQLLRPYLATYIVYNRHAEAKATDKWETPDELDNFIRSFRNGSMRNPVVEKVILETLRVVRDIWRKYGKIDEIHVELGREMKLPKDKRERIFKQNLDNEQTNLRIKALLTEFLNPELGIEDVRPFSPNHQERLKLYEKSVLEQVDDVPDYVSDIIKKFAESDVKKRPSASDIKRYRLWLDQKYVSPYTGKTIPLSRLFTTDYQVDHIIPQAFFFDDTLNNKVICEAKVNSDKSSRFGRQFIKEFEGRTIELGGGKTAKILSLEEYDNLVAETFKNNRRKRDNLMCEEVPDEFVSRHLNDTRHITRIVMQLLSNIVRERDERGNLEPEANSKNVVPCNGEITTRLKQDWGINDVWNSILAPRYERLNRKYAERMGLESSNHFGEMVNGHFQINMPLEYQKGFKPKRIDHRHHTMDAIVIACASRNIVNYLNNSNANQRNERLDLRATVCFKKLDTNSNGYKWVLKKPWPTFTEDTKQALLQTIVSFRQNIRVLTASTNFFDYIAENGKKARKKQSSDNHFAIRRQLHKDTVAGRVNLRSIKEVKFAAALDNPSRIVDKDLRTFVKFLISHGLSKAAVERDVADRFADFNPKKVEVYVYSDETDTPMIANRVTLDDSFNEKKIKTVTDTGIQKILLNHLRRHGGNSKDAFSAEGIAEMNNNIVSLNDGKFHLPIYKVRCSEIMGNKFAIGDGKKSSKFVEAAKGTNLFFAVYVNEEGERCEFATIPLRTVVDRLRRNLSPAPDVSEKGNRLLFTLSPNDLVYVPDNGEDVSTLSADTIDRNKIFKVVKFTGDRIFVIPSSLSRAIVSDSQIGLYEFNSLNIVELSPEGISIKKICIPLQTDRLGNISLK